MTSATGVRIVCQLGLMLMYMLLNTIGCSILCIHIYKCIKFVVATCSFILKNAIISTYVFYIYIFYDSLKHLVNTNFFNWSHCNSSKYMYKSCIDIPFQYFCKLTVDSTYFSQTFFNDVVRCQNFNGNCAMHFLLKLLGFPLSMFVV